jgi:PIN domain nuclease of toxin-antitoxin system
MKTKLLLDSHTFLWIVANKPEIRNAEPYLAQADTLYISTASWWEIAIKIGTGKLPLDYSLLQDVARRMGIITLGITAAHCQTLLSLPMIHRDPFDRMLVAQALSEDLPLLTHDATVAQYSDKIILF